MALSFPPFFAGRNSVGETTLQGTLGARTLFSSARSMQYEQYPAGKANKYMVLLDCNDPPGRITVFLVRLLVPVSYLIISELVVGIVYMTN
jgi:hypothetical protein